MEPLRLSGRDLTPGTVIEATRLHRRVELDSAARRRIQTSADAVVEVAQRQPVYGRNTGVGANRDAQVTDDSHGIRLLASHATTGATAYPQDIVRAAVLIRLNQIAAGGSGLPTRLADALAGLLNTDRLPVLHRGGALGTGDLGALAELGLALGDAVASPDVLPLLSSNAVTLAECCAIAVQSRDLMEAIPVVGALSLVALHGNPEVFDARVHSSRPQAGQQQVAATMASLLAGLAQPPARVQDPFGFRAFAQVLGPALELVHQLDDVVSIDVNAAAENPLVVDRSVLHNGNWHAMPVALALDGLRLALHSVATLSTSRLANLIDPELTGLTRFLASGPDASSGALMLEYVAHDSLALVRSDAQPATLGTATLSHGAEHHASFAPQAAALTTVLLDNLKTVLACELIAAVRAIRLAGTGPEQYGTARIAEFAAQAADELPAGLADRPLREDLTEARLLLANWGAAVASHGLT
jgi:histidine ammonia-lyase